MTATDTVFAGSIPATYDRYMVPLIFAPYAELVADRAKALAARPNSRDRRRHRRRHRSAAPGAARSGDCRDRPQSADARASRTASARLDRPLSAGRRARPAVRGRQLRPRRLPVRGDVLPRQGEGKFRGAARSPGWWPVHSRHLGQGRPQPGDKGRRRRRGRAFPRDAAAFYERIPFRYYEQEWIERDLRAAGFTEIHFETVELRSRAASARDAAIALTQGTPMRSEIEARDPATLQFATDAAEKALRQFEESDGLRRANVGAYRDCD